MERGDRRLLRDLDLVGRVVSERVPARERLEREVGPALLRHLLPESDSRPVRPGSIHGPRRVA
jgi:hypothetical protein